MSSITWQALDDALGAAVSSALREAALPALRVRDDTEKPLPRPSYRIDLAVADEARTAEYAERGAEVEVYYYPKDAHAPRSELLTAAEALRASLGEGIDIGGVYYSSTVYAAKAGTVIISSSNSVRGQYIVISHGSGNTTTYQHLSKRSVSVGAVVKQGQAIGVTGSSGVGSGPHLHFEITENGQLVDPLKYLTDYVKAWN